AFRSLPTEVALREVRHTCERLLRRLGPAADNVGPNWDLVGPGEAYVKALETASGKPLARERLLPESLPGGPFILTGNKEKPRCYPTLQAAVNTARDGELIEVRTDGPFPGFVLKDKARGGRLTVRAAPGYRPVVRTDIVLELPKAEVEIEGLAFEQAHLLG